MGAYLHRTTKQYFQSTSPASLPEALVNYIDNPDMSAVEGVSSKYWIVTGDIVTEMSQVEKDTIDAATLTAKREAAVNAMIDNFEGNSRQLVKLMISEINILRSQHGLSDRTMAQFKAQIRNGYGS